MKTILVLGSTYNSLENFRGKLIKELIIKKNKVIVSSGDSREKFLYLEENLKVFHHKIYLNRHSLNPFNEIISVFSILFLILKSKPDIILSYTIKPNMYVGLINLFTNKHFYPIVTGLGYVFYGKKNFLIKSIIIFLIKISFKSSKKVFFQNNDNLKVFTKNNMIKKRNAIVVPGSGIDTEFYNYSKLPETQLTFLMISRLIKEKGVIEFILAANIIKKRYKNIYFNLLYSLDNESKDSLKIEYINSLIINNSVKLISEKKDVRIYIKNSHVFVLPSYHEGLPRSNLEAMSIGRAILTTDVSGCRDTIIHNYNGYIIKHNSIFSLTKGILKMIKNKEKIEKMGKNSRIYAENNFHYKIINEKIINTLLNKN